MSFFYTSLEQIEDDKREVIQSQAISARGSKSQKLDDFLKLFDKKKKEDKVVDHKSNIAKVDNHKSNIAKLNKKI